MHTWRQRRHHHITFGFSIQNIFTCRQHKFRKTLNANRHTHTHKTKYIMYWGQPQHHRHRPVITAFELEIEFIPVLETNICWRIISWTRLSRAEASISLVFYRPAALISLLARQISCFHVLVEWDRVCVCVRRRPFNPTSELTVY